MNISNITTILLAGASICFGAFFGALRSKIFATKNKTTLHYSFYIFSALVFAISIIFLFSHWQELFSPNWFAIIVLSLALVSSIGLFYLTKKVLVVKDTFSIPELDPIINNFTQVADKNKIRLFGGDLNFFGNSTLDMDKNSQYTTLRSLNFNKVFILCAEPSEASTKLRYGKILFEMPNAELRHYHPEEADLRLRGRIIEVNGVSKLLMYTKVSTGTYQAIETDTANHSGALYNSIWDLVWSLAVKPNEEQLKTYKNMFQGGTK